MNTSKQQRTEQLLDAIGTLEDGILASALALTKKKSRRSVIGISASVAACLVACILIAAVIRMRPTPLPEDTATPATLSEVLRIAETSEAVERLSESELMLRDGQSRLIWQETGDEDYCVLPLSNAQANSLHTAAQQPTDRIEPIHISVRVWLVMSDGRVITPYLYPSHGNVGYGTLFDYEPECTPSNVLTDTVYEIVSSAITKG